MKQILLLILIGPLLTHSHQVLHNRNGVEDNQIGYGLRGRDSKFGTKFRFLIYPGNFIYFRSELLLLKIFASNISEHPVCLILMSFFHNIRLNLLRIDSL